METRKAAVAGRFYPSDPDDLREMISELGASGKEGPLPGEIIGAVVPHAGYIYSGRHAAQFFRLLAGASVRFDTAVIVHPLHAAWGGRPLADAHSEWETPLGPVKVDTRLRELAGLEISAEAHLAEHAGEVMVPFLQYYYPENFMILPVGMRDQTPEEASEIARGLFEGAKKLNRRIIVIASSDFSHYIDPETGYRKDQKVVDRILQMDPPGVYRAIHEHHVSACGYGPIMTLMYFSQQVCEIPEIRVLSRGHSGEVHPSREVVDYITILFSRPGTLR